MGLRTPARHEDPQRGPPAPPGEQHPGEDQEGQERERRRSEVVRTHELRGAPSPRDRERSDDGHRHRDAAEVTTGGDSGGGARARADEHPAQEQADGVEVRQATREAEDVVLERTRVVHRDASRRVQAGRALPHERRVGRPHVRRAQCDERIVTGGPPPVEDQPDGREDERHEDRHRPDEILPTGESRHTAPGTGRRARGAGRGALAGVPRSPSHHASSSSDRAGPRGD